MTETVYRMASDDDGAALGKLFLAAAYPDHGVDWGAARVGSWWLLAERDGDLRGAVQVIASKPVGYIGDIVVHPDERGRRPDGAGSLAKRPGAVGYQLYLRAVMLLQDAGVEVVMGIVHEDLTGLQRIMRRYGAQDLGHYTLFAMGLKPCA